jgi:hypothetical protein
MLYNAGTDLPGSRLSLTNLFVEIHTLLKRGDVLFASGKGFIKARK